MKVRCISPIKNPERGKENEPRPQVGDVCIVTASRYLPCYDATYYQLAGYPKVNGYQSTHFAIIPDTSADEMNEEARESIVNLETVPA